MLFYLGVLLIYPALVFWECLHIFEEWFQQWSLILMIFCSLSLPWLTWQHKLLSPHPTWILLSPNFPAIQFSIFCGCAPWMPSRALSLVLPSFLLNTKAVHFYRTSSDFLAFAKTNLPCIFSLLYYLSHVRLNFPTTLRWELTLLP